MQLLQGSVPGFEASIVVMARMLVLALLAACAVGTVKGQLPGMPMPEVCSGPAERPMPRTDLNWPANQTKLANELHQLDQSKVCNQYPQEIQIEQKD